MIKQLITDIAFDNIKLSQAITRAKLVENKIKNETFKKWLNKELEGYEYDDPYLPSYRKIWSVINLIAEFGFGRHERFPVLLNESFGQKTIDAINFHKIIEPIAIVEKELDIFKDSKGYLNIPPHQVELLANLFEDQISDQGGVIRQGDREVGKIHYENVIEQTKQKLLDILMNLETEFPNLLNDYIMTKENNEKVENIITNNIYGSNNPLNIAAGKHIEQENIQNIYANQDFSKLEELGVDKKEVEILKQIVQTHGKDKATLKGKSMKWLGGVLASVAGRGLYDNIPAITNFIHTLTN